MRNHQNVLRNERGGIVIVTMVIISVVLVIFSGIVSYKLSELSKQSFKVNEAYRYLNVMEQMGMMIARARELGKSTCPAGTYSEIISTVNFCLPSYNASGNLNTACITDDSQKDSSGNAIRYCLQAASGLSVSSNESSVDKSNVADVNFNIVPERVPSLLEKAFVAMVTMLPSAHAACDLNQSWMLPCTPTNDGTANVAATMNEPTIAPVSYTTAPTGSGAQSGNSYASRNNLETFAPVLSAWTPSGTNSANEIYTPNCDVGTYESHYWLGCMSCAQDKVLCVDIRMCPPNYTGATSCSNPYRQRIALYPDTNI